MTCAIIAITAASLGATLGFVLAVILHASAQADKRS
jgi:hypothetical protein